MGHSWPFASPSKVFPDAPLNNSSSWLSCSPDCESVLRMVQRASRVALPELRDSARVLPGTGEGGNGGRHSNLVLGVQDSKSSGASGNATAPKMQDRGNTDTRSMLRIVSHCIYCIGSRTDAAPLAAKLKSAAGPERTPSRSHCYPFYLLALSVAKTAIIAFTASRSEEEFVAPHRYFEHAAIPHKRFRFSASAPCCQSSCELNP